MRNRFASHFECALPTVIAYSTCNIQQCSIHLQLWTAQYFGIMDMEIDKELDTQEVNTSNTVYLVGELADKFVGSNLPSNRDVLSVLLKRRKTNKELLKLSVKTTAAELNRFWSSFDIPTMSMPAIKERIIKLHSQWHNLCKSSKKCSDVIKQKETYFREKINDLFDVANKHALERIKSPQTELFLLQQRAKNFMESITINTCDYIPDRELSERTSENLVAIPEHSVNIPEFDLHEITEVSNRAEQEQKQKEKIEQQKQATGNF